MLNYIAQHIPQDNERLNKSVAVVKKSLTGLETLVTDILELTKTKSLQESEQPIDVASLVRDTCERLSHMNNYDRIHFDFQMNFSGPLFGQKNKVMLVVENLISNAVMIPRNSPNP